jgi:formamidopyrimidine-DNA glycosylase
MPELPEVELVARSLDKLVSGRCIAKASLIRERLVPDSTPKRFARDLQNARINFVHRRGKHVLFDLDNGRTLITHLRMSGRFMLLPADRDDPKFTHAAFYFDDEARLVFEDQRHFGMMKIVRTEELTKAKELSKLAPEPFSDEFNFDYLRDRLRASKRTIKAFLLDQTKVCGLGNIYAAEALFLAGVHPAARSNRLSRPRTQILLEKIRETLGEAIGAGSTLNVDPENIDGSYYGGGYESRWRVYDREQMPCPSCGASIVRLKQGGRSSYFCPKCQKR